MGMLRISHSTEEERPFSGLRVRTRIVLRNLKVETVDQLATLTAYQILEAPNVGEQTLPEIVDFLAINGRTLSS